MMDNLQSRPQPQESKKGICDKGPFCEPRCMKDHFPDPKPAPTSSMLPETVLYPVSHDTKYPSWQREAKLKFPGSIQKHNRNLSICSIIYTYKRSFADPTDPHYYEPHDKRSMLINGCVCKPCSTSHYLTILTLGERKGELTFLNPNVDSTYIPASQSVYSVNSFLDSKMPLYPLGSPLLFSQLHSSMTFLFKSLGTAELQVCATRIFKQEEIGLPFTPKSAFNEWMAWAKTQEAEFKATLKEMEANWVQSAKQLKESQGKLRKAPGEEIQTEVLNLASEVKEYKEKLEQKRKSEVIIKPGFQQYFEELMVTFHKCFLLERWKLLEQIEKVSRNANFCLAHSVNLGKLKELISFIQKTADMILAGKQEEKYLRSRLQNLNESIKNGPLQYQLEEEVPKQDENTLRYPLMNAYNVLKHHAHEPSSKKRIVYAALAMLAYLSDDSGEPNSAFDRNLWCEVLAWHGIQIFLPAGKYNRQQEVYAPIWMVKHDFGWEKKTVYLGDYSVGIRKKWSDLDILYRAALQCYLDHQKEVHPHVQLKPLMRQNQKRWCGDDQCQDPRHFFTCLHGNDDKIKDCCRNNMHKH